MRHWKSSLFRSIKTVVFATKLNLLMPFGPLAILVHKFIGHNGWVFSDFGLAKDGPTGDKSYVSTRIMGTYGYAAPEYMATGHLTARSDIYSFGVVLLELLTGRRAIDKNRPSGEHNLVEWAKPHLTSKRKIFHVMDARIEGQYSVSDALKAANIAIQCISSEPKFRPNMNQVVSALEQLQDSESSVPTQNEPNQRSHQNNFVLSEGPRNRRMSIGCLFVCFIIVVVIHGFADFCKNKMQVP